MEHSYSCPQFKKRFSRQYPLKMHLKVHTGERLLACTHAERGSQRGDTFGYISRKSTQPMHTECTKHWEHLLFQCN
jgi:uncharacterized Zn-finger protein